MELEREFEFARQKSKLTERIRGSFSSAKDNVKDLDPGAYVRTLSVPE